jgi:hypothetical protein
LDQETDMPSPTPSSTRRLVAAAVTSLVAVILLVLVATGQHAATGAAAATTLRMRFEPGALKFVDAPPRAEDESTPPSMGDYLVLTNKLFRGQKRVGALHATCMFANRASDPARLRLLCTGAYKLPRGTLTGTALLRGGGRLQRIAITGGTGRFAGMTGTATETSGHGGNGRVVIRVR